MNSLQAITRLEAHTLCRMLTGRDADPSTLGIRFTPLGGCLSSQHRPEGKQKEWESYLKFQPDADELVRAVNEADPDSEPPTVEAAAGTSGDKQGAFRPEIFGAADFFARPFHQEWLIKQVLVANQPAAVGAPKKTLKTSTTLDLMISLASGTSFLGAFDVPKPVPVLLLSGESGGAVLQNTARRICAARSLPPENLEGRFFIGLELPSLSDEQHLAELARIIKAREIRVVAIDPLYLCMMKGLAPGRKIDPSSLFDTGPLFLDVFRVCLEAGATPILIHHFRKGMKDADSPGDLDDFSFAGLAESVRQWLLWQRVETFDHKEGKHKLRLTAAGSVGHSGEQGLRILNS